MAALQVCGVVEFVFVCAALSPPPLCMVGLVVQLDLDEVLEPSADEKVCVCVFLGMCVDVGVGVWDCGCVCVCGCLCMCL